MSNLALSLGEMITFGELARGVEGEVEVEMAMALGQPPGPWPLMALVPVLADGHEIGRIEKIQFVSGETVYQFCSTSGNTTFSCLSSQSVLDRLQEVLR
jgi:hypothetical protein